MKYWVITEEQLHDLVDRRCARAIAAGDIPEHAVDEVRRTVFGVLDTSEARQMGVLRGDAARGEDDDQ